MKYLLIILFCLIGRNAFAQLPANPTPTQFSTGFFRHGWDKSDSGHVNAVRDTNFVPRYAGTHIMWQRPGIDTAEWFYTGQRWIKLLKTGDAAGGGISSVTGLFGLTNVNDSTLDADTTRITGLPTYWYVDSVASTITGTPNANTGSGYRWLIPSTQQIKTVFPGYAQIIDSTTNANALTFYPDTSLLKDSIFVSNITGSDNLAMPTIFARNDTVFGIGLRAGTGITLAKNSDSTITITGTSDTTTLNTIYWKTIGNTGGSGRIFGTLDNTDVTLVTNNIIRGALKAGGPLYMGTAPSATVTRGIYTSDTLYGIGGLNLNTSPASFTGFTQASSVISFKIANSTITTLQNTTVLWQTTRSDGTLSGSKYYYNVAMQPQPASNSTAEVSLYRANMNYAAGADTNTYFSRLNGKYVAFYVDSLSWSTGGYRFVPNRFRAFENYLGDNYFNTSRGITYIGYSSASSSTFGFNVSKTISFAKDSLPTITAIDDGFLVVLDSSNNQLKKILTSNLGLMTTNFSNVAGTLADDFGGTGQSTYATGDMLYASATNTLSKLTAGGDSTVIRYIGGVPTVGPLLTSSTYIATLTNVTNVAASTFQDAYYQRIGNIVTVYGTILIDATTLGTQTQLDISLPLASNLAVATDVSGLIISNDSSDATYGIITGNNTNDRASAFFVAGTTGGNATYRFSFSYKIL